MASLPPRWTLPAVGHPGCPELGLGVDGAGGLPLASAPPLALRASAQVLRPACRHEDRSGIGQSLFGQEVYCRLRERATAGRAHCARQGRKAGTLRKLRRRRWQLGLRVLRVCMSFPGLKRLHMSTLGPAQGLLTATLLEQSGSQGRVVEKAGLHPGPTVQTPQASSLTQAPKGCRAGITAVRFWDVSVLHPASPAGAPIEQRLLPPRPAPEFLFPGWGWGLG